MTLPRRPGRRRRPRGGRVRERDAGDPPRPAVPARGARAAAPTGPRAASACSAARSSAWSCRCRASPGSCPCRCVRVGRRGGRRPARSSSPSRPAGASPPRSPPRPAGHGVDQVVVSSVANEYCGLLHHARGVRASSATRAATRSTAPRTQPFLAAHAGRLAGEVVRAGLVGDLLPDRAFDLHHRPTCRRRSGRRRARRRRGAATFTDATSATDPMWEQAWIDVAPGGLRWDAAARPGRDGRRPRRLAARGAPTDARSTTVAATSRSCTWVPATTATTGTRPAGGIPASVPAAATASCWSAQDGRPEVAGDPFD